MEHVATAPGLFPLPDWAKGELSDLKGHQKEDLVSGDESEEIEAVYDRARAEVVEGQADAGLDGVVEGQLRWDDMLAHPLCVHEHVETGGIVRYYDNNNFYRDPVVRGDLTFSGDVARELEAAADLSDSPTAVLPGPYSLADLATDEHYGDDEEFLAAVAEFLAGEVEEFPAHETLALLDPSLAANPPDEGAALVDAIDAVAAATDADVVVRPYWGVPPEGVYARLLDADVDALGYDLVTDLDGAVDLVAEYGAAPTVSLGVADGQNTRIEPPTEIHRRADAFADAAGGVETAALTTNTELFYLPVSKAWEKLDALAAAADVEVVA